MKAIHFGAGNIGRGFIGALLAQSRYQVYFVDINDDVVNQLKTEQSYNVILAGEEQTTETIDHVTALNTNSERQQVVEQMAQADIVTTAVGPNVLPIISDVIAEGLDRRLSTHAAPLNLIACENMVGGGDALKAAVKEHLSVEPDTWDEPFGFPNAAVDRIVPMQSSAGIDVAVEPFYEWVVDQSGIVGEAPDVKGITYVDDLQPYIERKLFTVNTGHAITAYLGYAKGLSTIKEAIETPSIRESVECALSETGELLIQKHGFNRTEHEAYVQKIIERFRNPNISDEVTRVARTPIRKLGHDERLVSPARQLLDINQESSVTYLATGIAAALQYDYSEDPEAVQLQASIEEQGLEATLADITQLPQDHPLFALILEQTHRL
ncbi:mannitol-1-phosphate 5-dehydrogenase [Tuberibacillus sp. Marseille-P3662]|uniref:mannitol-1-phosphate 5-dehydrogenase n=1 Tax=Tuberibacillus sp. Marseille-P3662 TaxID=1965358 RepID=UPI000A1CEB9F|nr:mannitol-1-phosphate 5-dehydrogenase [Tuberibacillus sp. Marseille-P3662]